MSDNTIQMLIAITFGMLLALTAFLILKPTSYNIEVANTSMPLQK